MGKKISGEGKKRVKKKIYKKRRRQTWNLKKLKQAKLHFAKDKIQVEPKDMRKIFGWGIQIVCVCLAAFMLVSFFGQRVSNAGDSMRPTLQNGEIVLMNRLIYNASKPKRGDVIAFKPNGNENAHYSIKRVVGLPGETVQILSGMVYIDGMRLDEHYGNEIMENPGIAEEPLTLGEDEYFVLGDNRNNSSDSRASDVGLIHRKDLIGRAWIRVWPLSQIGVIHHE